jgi:hypothetical protein
MRGKFATGMIGSLPRKGGGNDVAWPSINSREQRA